MNLPVAGVMHQPEIREVVCPAVMLGPHVVDVDLFPIVQSLVADRTAPVLPPGELPRATSRAVDVLPPLAPVVLEGRVIGGIRGGHESMADDGGPGEFPQGAMPFLILKHESREMLGLTDNLRYNGLHHSSATQTRGVPVCVSNFNSSCAAMRVRKRPSPM